MSYEALISLLFSTLEESQLLLASPYAPAHHVFSSSCHAIPHFCSPQHIPCASPSPISVGSAGLLTVSQPLPRPEGPSTRCKISDAASQMPSRREQSLLFAESLCDAALYAISLPQRHTADLCSPR